jgi:phage terminase large subunit-like protein
MRDYVAIASQYQADVLSGKIPACKWVRMACERNRRDLARQGTPDFPYQFDPVAAAAICRFGEMLPYVSGKGFAAVLGYDDRDRAIYKTVDLQPWQLWILTTIFGWKNARGLRRFRVGLILVPRKNGKSSLCAIIALYMLTEEGEPGAQVISAATTRDQAKNIAEIAWEMAKRSPLFREHYGVELGSATTLSLRVSSTASKFVPLSADANSLDGLNISCGLIDEFQNHKTPAVWNVVDTSTSARSQPFIGGIGTAGEQFGGVCHQKLNYLEKVLDGTAVDELFFGLNYTIDADDDYWLPDTARKANPNYGISVDPDDIARKVNQARQSPGELDGVLTKHFNVWLRTKSAWMLGSLWQTCAAAGLTLESLKQYPCWIGVDLAEIRDIAALMVLFKLGPEQYAAIGRVLSTGRSGQEITDRGVVRLGAPEIYSANRWVSVGLRPHRRRPCETLRPVAERERDRLRSRARRADAAIAGEAPRAAHGQGRR